MEQKIALIAGASGLTGKILLNHLLNSEIYKKVIVITHRRLQISHSKAEEIIINFNKLSEYKSLMIADDVFCCLGTTIKKAKTQEAFKDVDLHYPLQLAKITKEMGAKKFLVISAMGASEKSLFFYSRVKGVLENELQKVAFGTLYIFQPSLLMGKRDEFRFGEYIGIAFYKAVSWLMFGYLKKYKGIKASAVANAIFKMAQHDDKGVHIVSSEMISKLENTI